jgi:NodT family efflux transporter outer membrane factor (OMF) lipoprotein
MRKPELRSRCWLLAMTLAGCSLAPAYKVPAVPVAPLIRTTARGSRRSRPTSCRAITGGSSITTQQLDQLQQRLLANNADLAAALAHYRQAQAFNLQTRSALFPHVSANANGQRDRQSDTKPLRGATSPANYNSYTVGAEVDYELDLWGRVRNTVEAGKDDTLAAAADLASAQLSLQAQLTDNYIQLRGTRSADRAAAAKHRRVSESAAADPDLACRWHRVRAGCGARADAAVLGEIAVVAGAGAACAGQGCDRGAGRRLGRSVQLAAQTGAIDLPQVPASVPSTLLQRRPDIAAAERRVAAANAQSAWPAPPISLHSLSAQGGFQSAAYAGLLTAPNRFWAIGPSLFETIFDGGRRKAGVAAAKAATDEAGARYRGVVLNAFAQVEDNLAQLDHVGTAMTDQKDAADAAQHAMDLATDRYKQGAVSYLNVVQAQTVALDAKRGLLELDTKQLRASVQLIAHFGGGWSIDQLVSNR